MREIGSWLGGLKAAFREFRLRATADWIAAFEFGN